MARQLNGPWDPISGKAGPLIGRIVDGEGIITGLHKKSNKPPTRKQLDQQLKWALVTDILAYIGHILNIGFATTKKRVSAMNEAVSYNLLNAITGVSPVFTIDFAKMSISRGKLAAFKELVVGSDTQSEIKLSWNPQIQTSSHGSPTDQLTIVVYEPTTKEFVTLTDAAMRSAGEYDMTVPADFGGKQVHCYVFFKSATRVSNSEYVGPVTVIG